MGFSSEDAGRILLRTIDPESYTAYYRDLSQFRPHVRIAARAFEELDNDPAFFMGHQYLGGRWEMTGVGSAGEMGWRSTSVSFRHRTKGHFTFSVVECGDYTDGSRFVVQGFRTGVERYVTLGPATFEVRFDPSKPYEEQAWAGRLAEMTAKATLEETLQALADFEKHEFRHEMYYLEAYEEWLEHYFLLTRKEWPRGAWSSRERLWAKEADRLAGLLSAPASCLSIGNQWEGQIIEAQLAAYRRYAGKPYHLSSEQVKAIRSGSTASGGCDANRP